MKYIVKHYIEMALREKVVKERPDYPASWVDKVVLSSLGPNCAYVNKDVLYRAIELAATTSGR